MAAPPPPQLTEYDDGPAGSIVGSSRGTRRGRWKLAVAALPLLFAVALLLVNLLGSADRGVDDSGVDAEDAADEGLADEGWAVVAGAPQNAGISVPAPVPTPAASAPVPPDGHRAVAIRFAAPDAVDLVAERDRIDVVGLDGEVLAAGLEVLQDRTTGQARVLVVAVPAEQAPELAAVAAARDLTLLLAHTAG